MDGKIIKQKKSSGAITKFNINAPMVLYQQSQAFVFVPDIEKLGEHLEKISGMEFHFKVAKDCNYFYRFWLEPKKING